MRPDVPVATSLPKDVREALVAASKIRAHHERAVAIDEAVKRAKLRHPQFFKTDREI